MHATRLAFLVADGDEAFAGRVARDLHRVHPSGEIDLVTRGDACLARVASRPYDVILVDDGLPFGGAAPVLESLAGRDDAPPVIVLTAAGSGEAALDLFRQGAADCLVKSADGLPALAVRAMDLAGRHRARREGEGRLRELRTFEERVIESMPTALIVADARDRVVLANQAFCRTRGLSRASILGRPVAACLPSDLLDAGGLRRALDHVRRTGAATRLHGVVDTTDPERPRTLQIQVSPLNDGIEAGEGERLLVILEDVSEKEALDHENRRTREYLESLVESSLDAILTTDTRGRIGFCSRAVTDLLGYAPGEMLGRPIAAFYEGGVDEARAIMEALRLRGKLAAHETEFVARDGRRVPVMLSASLLRDHQGRVIGTVGISKDMSERRAAERKIRALKEFNENVLRNLRSAILVTGNDGRIVYANRAATAMLGYTDAEILGLEAGNIFVAEKDGPALLLRAIARRETFRNAETIALTKGGKRLPVGLSTSILSDAAGAAQGAIAIVQDLSEIRALREQVFQSEKMAGIGQLAAGVAHEINNPMGFIHANLARMGEYVGDLQKVFGLYESLRRAVATGDGERVREAFGRVAKECDAIDVPFLLDDLTKAVAESTEGAERITRIVRNLREFSHLDPAEREPADIHQCIDGAAGMLRPMLGDRVELLREYGDLPPVRCYPLLLGQVFMNLLVNACQAIEGRGAIRVRTRAEEGRVVIAIADTGQGIAPDHLDRIFDPFFTTKEVGVGTGLGLSTSYNIIQRHRGRIAVRSEPGRGTLFTIELPVG